MKLNNSLVTLASQLILMTIPLGAQPTATGESTLELVTDRPDQTESSIVVPPGYFQLETGWGVTRNGEKNNHQFPTTLLRIGMIPSVELRIGFDGDLWESDTPSPQQREEGELGAKFNLWQEEGWIPETGLLFSVSVPRRADPALRLALSHDLSDRISIAYNLGAAWESEPDGDSDMDRLSVFQYTATLGVGLNGRTGAFLEVFGDLPLSAEGGPEHLLDGGLT
ncbi:MAG: transporter, partial [Acidobacteriota bacterium]